MNLGSDQSVKLWWGIGRHRILRPKKRYQCHLDLLEMENGSYTLDWDMELQKSW